MLLVVDSVGTKVRKQRTQSSLLLENDGKKDRSLQSLDVGEWTVLYPRAHPRKLSFARHHDESGHPSYRVLDVICGWRSGEADPSIVVTPSSTHTCTSRIIGRVATADTFLDTIDV
jgi:hypothetical protein